MTMAAAVYVVLTVAISPLSYGSVQFRISEILVLLCVYHKDYAVSMTVGCLIANFFSPLGIWDIGFGTLATLIAVVGIVLCRKNIWIASLFPVLANGLIVGAELTILFQELPFWLNFLSVAFGEFVVVTVLGCPIFRLLEKNESFMRAIGA